MMRDKRRCKKHRDKAMRCNGFRCCYCNRKILSASAVLRYRPGAFVRRHGVIWRTPLGDILRCAMATAEHIVPLADGGNNTRGNVTAACSRCNVKRGNLALKTRNALRQSGAATC